MTDRARDVIARALLHAENVPDSLRWKALEVFNNHADAILAAFAQEGLAVVDVDELMIEIRNLPAGTVRDRLLSMTSAAKGTTDE